MFNEKLNSAKVLVLIMKMIEITKFLLEILRGIQVKLVFGAMKFLHIPKESSTTLESNLAICSEDGTILCFPSLEQFYPRNT